MVESESVKTQKPGLRLFVNSDFGLIVTDVVGVRGARARLEVRIDLTMI